MNDGGFKSLVEEVKRGNHTPLILGIITSGKQVVFVEYDAETASTV